jgi:hypothetical protein
MILKRKFADVQSKVMKLLTKYISKQFANPSGVGGGM